MKNKVIFHSIILLFLFVSSAVVAQDNYINYNVDWKGYNPEPNAGRSDEIMATLNYNESTGMLDSFSFEVVISSFYNTIGVYNVLDRDRDRLNRPEPFPKLSFKSETIKLKRGEFVIKGLLSYYEQRIPTTIIVSQKEENNYIQFFGNFSLNRNQRPQIDMDFSATFIKNNLK